MVKKIMSFKALILLLMISFSCTFLTANSFAESQASMAASHKAKNGLTGEYYNSKNLTELKFSRVDPRISFDWEGGSPNKKIDTDTFSIRWTGQVEPRYSETYTFHAITDDGVRLWVNNQLIIDEWNGIAATEYKGTIQLSANKKYNIKMEYFENKNDACSKLLWSSKSQAKEIIPKERLYPVIGPVPAPVTPPSPVKLDISAYFNEDAFSYDSKRSDGDYDGSNHTYSADLANANPVYGNASYVFGPFKNGSDNSVNCKGQTINIKQQSYESIRFAGSATNGNKAGVIRINYKDGTHTYASITQKDWCTSDTSGEKIVQKMSHRHSSQSDNTINTYIFAYYISPDKTKTATSITLPEQENMHILAVTLIPAAGQTPKPEKGNGLKGEYFDNMNFTDSTLVRTDPTVNFDWGTASPDKSMGPNTFSVRWTGKIKPDYSEAYTFQTAADDGVRLWVNDKLIINDWTDHAAVERNGTLSLTAGQKYNIKLEYYDNQDKASIKLLWSSHSQSKEIIPEFNLYH